MDLKTLEDAPDGTSMSMEEFLTLVRFNDAGLIPGIAQDASNGRVLMLAWMNRESILASLQDGYATYFSRSRNALWRKGETSGHLQRLIDLRFDCDADAILMRVEQTGAACHTERPSCFYFQATQDTVTVNTSQE